MYNKEIVGPTEYWMYRSVVDKQLFDVYEVCSTMQASDEHSDWKYEKTKVLSLVSFDTASNFIQEKETYESVQF